ncbi:MAG: excinuclease ABC subunit UvrA [Sporomusaceae bacterium]|nr:excinuclease ABC subunit UvrA [Sporomusaceae bacterium]
MPKNKLVVFTGVSGSGKSSLVFDTIYTEAQRQLIETFGSFARKRLPKLSRPLVDEIMNLSTAIVIDQKRLGRNLRSTVGTATEILPYMRMLYSKCGKPYIGHAFNFSFNNPEGMCPECKGLGKKIMIDMDMFMDRKKSLNEGAINYPDYKVDSWFWRELVGCGLFDADKSLEKFTETELNNLLYAENIPIDKKHGGGVYAKNFEGIIRRLERLNAAKGEDESEDDKKSIHEQFFIYTKCPACNGERINEKARSVLINGKNIAELSDMELTELNEFLSKLDMPLATPLVSKMRSIISHLIDIGVGYLSLNRTVATLSGGESQRVKMARQLDCDLTGLMYILDEPSIGLHPRDNKKLIEILKKLRDMGNSVFVVEHDPEIIASADWIIDVGEKAGVNGGNILFRGTVDALKKTDSPTSVFIKDARNSNENKGFTKFIKSVFANNEKSNVYERKAWTDYFEISNATANNLKNVSVKIPKGILTCITGVAGSGKSSLIHEVFLKMHTDAIVVDQTAPVKSPRANPATYIGVFDLMRKEIAKATGENASLFSFNSKGGCPTCNGMGYVTVEMGFMDDMKMVCEECGGHRYRDEVLELRYKGKNIYEILELTASEALVFFNGKEIKKRLAALCDVGLDYLRIGQAFSTLSGGECQRIKIASELHKEGNVYVMDEPTTGLHMSDTHKFMGIIRELVKKNNTIMIIEHNLDVIKHADWVIDLGIEGGSKGGEILFEGTPEELTKCEVGYTGKYLKDVL